MPNRDDNPIVWDDSVPYREKLKQFKKNSFHIDGGEVYETLTEFVRNRPPKDFSGGISPSQLGGCPRALWFKLKGLKETTPAGIGTQTTWELGHQYERTMVEAFAWKGSLLRWFPDKTEYQDIPGVDLKQTEYAEPFKFELPDGTPLVGTPDFLITYNGKVTVADAKTARSDSFQYVGPTQEELKKEKMTYYWQTTAYMLLLHKNADRLKEMGLEPPEQGLVFMYDKDSGIPKRELIVQPSRDEYLAVGEKASLVWKHFKEDTPPPCTCADSTWLLEYCGYGTPGTRHTNKKGKTVNHECCEPDVVESNQPAETEEAPA